MNNNAIEKHEAKAMEKSEQTRPAAIFTPLVDIVETDEAFTFQADMPGANAEDIDVTYQSNVLTIQAKVRPQQRQNPVLQEYSTGNYYRQFSLNTPIDPDGIKANYHDGVLDLLLPKAAAARARKIPIRAAT